MTESEREQCAKIVEETPPVTGGYTEFGVWMHTEDAAETLANAADRIRALTITPTPTPENAVTFEPITDLIPAIRSSEPPAPAPTTQERVERFQAAHQALCAEHRAKIEVKTYCLLATGGRVEAVIPGIVGEAVLVLE